MTNALPEADVSGGAELDADQAIQALDAMCERIAVRVDDDEVVMRCLGSGPPLILLHGGHGSWLHWVRNAAELARSHTVWMPDMPGYGESSSVLSGELDHLVERLHRCLLTVAGPSQRWGLVGFSFGGLVASCLAARDVGIRRLALVGPVGHGGPRRQVVRPLAWKHLQADQRGDEWRNVMRQNLLAQMLHQNASVDALAMELHWRSCVATRFHSKRYSRSSLLRDCLASYLGKCLLMWGLEDVTASQAVFDVADWTPSGSHHVCLLSECGHWAMYEAPVATNDGLKRLLD